MVAVFTGSGVFFIVEGESNKLPDFLGANRENEFFEVLEEADDFDEDPTDPLLAPPQPASSFESGTKTIEAMTNAKNIFFMGIPL
ncbi:MAG: hypothetical protein NT118_12020 [Lentisphaerae bacterium]|nr:hypothetical protein [Lentisphaerota bacterium]